MRPSTPNRSERFATAATLVLLLSAALVLVWRPVALETDLTAFLPLSPAGIEGGAGELLLSDAAHQGVLLAAIEGGEPALRATASRQLAAELETQPEVVAVHNGAASSGLDRLEPLFAYRFLLSPAVESAAFEADALRRKLEEQRRALAQPGGGGARQWLESDPLGAWRSLLSEWHTAHRLPRPHGVWASADGSRALLVVETTLGGLDPQAQARWLATLRSDFAAARAAPELTLKVTGPAAFAADSSHLVRAEMVRLSILSSLLAAGVLLFSLRSLRRAAVAGLPLLGGIVGGTALVTALYGQIHGIALAFGVLLVGVTLDYPLHLLTHHQRHPAAPWTTARHLWPTLRLSAATTLLGCGAMAVAELRGLAQLGLFAAGALPLAVLTTRYLLPWLLPSAAPGSTPPPPAPAVAPEGQCVARRTRTLWPIAALVVVALLSLGAQRDALWQADLTALNPVPTAMRTLDGELRQQLGVGDLRYIGVIEAADVQTVLTASHALTADLQALVEEELISGFDHPARWLPPASVQLARREQLPEAAVLQQRLTPIAAELGFRAETFAPFVEAVAASRALAPLTPESLPASGIDHRLDRLLIAADGRWLGIVELRGVTAPTQLAERLTAASGGAATLLDTTAVVTAGLEQFRHHALLHLSGGLLAMVALLWWGLGALGPSLRLLCAPLSAVLITAAVLVSLGQPLSIFHLVALLLVAGLGVDYALFFLRHTASAEQRRTTVRAVLLCVASTLTVFGAMALSSLAVLAEIGLTVVLGALIALLLSWLTVGAGAHRGDHPAPPPSPGEATHSPRRA